jgi:K+-transporting ATPase KdpF subunit
VSALHAIALLLVLVLFAYLVYAFFRPERF